MTRTRTSAAAGFDVARIRDDFPILARTVHGHPLAYLDNAATAQKPRAVLEAMERYYETTNANVHRGVHELSLGATRAYEEARSRMQRFLGAARPEEIIFVRGATEAINLVAASWGRANLRPGDEILLTNLEHHSNIVPWQMVAQATGATIRVAPIDDAGTILLDEYARLLSPRTKIAALIHVSNALGTINPVAEMTRLAHERGAVVLLDGAQAAPHLPIDVQEIGCDFYAVAGHKMFGPTGIGVLYGRHALLAAMPPYQGGGDMIKSVRFEETVYNDPPNRFEAGTPNIAGAIGLGAAAEYLRSLGMERIVAYEHELLELTVAALADVPDLRLVGTAPEKASVVSFMIGDVHPHDVGTILDEEGVAIRTGHHCTQPLMERLGLVATARASLAFYNTPEEIGALVRGLHRVREIFG
jgi:cysteine desulfurase/selenocysteine lyase